MAAQTARRCSGLVDRMMAYGSRGLARQSILEPLSASSTMPNDKSTATSGKFMQRRPYSGETTVTATLFPGDGIGPEIAVSVKEVGIQFLQSLRSGSEFSFLFVRVRSA